MSSIVLSPQDVRELRDLFRKGGCSDEMSREDRRSLNLLEGEEIITAIAKGRGGIIGVFDRGNNCFADFTVNGLVRHQGPFSTIITNNRFIFIEPHFELRFEELTGYQSNAQLIKGRPKYTLNQGDIEYTFLASLTTGTGPVGTYFSILNQVGEDGRQAKENWNKAWAYLAAFNELLVTIGEVWKQQTN